MAASSQDDGLITSINVTPLVDVVLVLLIILMVTAQFVAQQSIAVELPTASTSASVPHSVSISIDKAQQLYLDGEPLDASRLKQRLQALRRAQPALQAVIAADGRVAYQRVVDVMDLLRSLQIERFAFNVQPPTTP